MKVTACGLREVYETNMLALSLSYTILMYRNPKLVARWGGLCEEYANGILSHNLFRIALCQSEINKSNYFRNGK
jgi:hypothetical protein